MEFITATLRNLQRQYVPPPGRTGELFLANLNQIQARTDRLFYYLLLIQYPAAVAVALLWSPLAWSGSTRSIHFHVYMAVLFGGLLTSLPVFLIRTSPASPLTRHAIAIAQMLMGALLIHLSGGRIETHFHVFGSLAFLAFYRDVRVLATATVVVATDHLVRGMLVPESVYGVMSAGNWRFLEHAFWVVFENTFLSLSCVQGRAQLSAMALQQVQLEEVNERIEKVVCARTHELSKRTEELAAARDAAMESTRLKSQFLANVSHEIRTPMNGVLGMTSLLLDTELSHDQRDYALTVQRSGEGLLIIINDILDFSKIEAGKLTLERVDFALWNEIEDVVCLLGEAAERKHLELVCEIDSTVPAVVVADAGRLRQILVNLIGNAIKFTEQGEVTIRVTSAGHGENTSWVRFEIMDTGIGIGEHARTRLFQPFVQVDGSITRKHEGTGLGLVISKELVTLMGGKIGVESQPGVGSTFWFEIPIQVLSITKDASLMQSAVLRGLRVLIVDDNCTNREVMLRTVESWGMLGTASSDGPQALTTLDDAYQRGEPFDIVLLDLQMPQMDGIQVARAIRERAHFWSTRVLMLTSLGQRSVCNSLATAGIAACVVKPVRREHLFLMIGRLCGKLFNAEPAGKLREAQTRARVTELNVLVAEDNLVNQRVVTRLLERLGHRYEVVCDGQAAVEALRRAHYDVVLMDCQMPGVDGFEATKTIRSLSGPAGRVPIVGVTANAMIGDRELCLAAGMTGYVAKPVRLGALEKALGDILCCHVAADEQQLSE